MRYHSSPFRRDVGDCHPTPLLVPGNSTVFAKYLINIGLAMGSSPTHPLPPKTLLGWDPFTFTVVLFFPHSSTLVGLPPFRPHGWSAEWCVGTLWSSWRVGPMVG